ncbi:uncharacterized protein LOC103512715 [Diaphorina citri]|uniref:adenylate cyclase n=1 Tax=Diaphorina citri TaxID=121845 RepID=A0A3Q0J0B3_DIACI|nr:uncharacterized protein LOC103512715 [Diaphorina citri]
MRIGVHSGKIFSGILGVCKWQYDIWSQDVVIANHMEQTGRPGMVHVTQQTLKLLGNDYDWEPNCGNKSPLLDKLNIKTFLIKPRKQGRLNEEDFNTLVTDIIYIAVQRGSHDKLQRKLLDDEPLYDSVASDEEQQVTPTTNLITTKQSQLESQLMISEAHITHLNNEIAKLKTQVQQVIGENETLKAALNARNSATHHQPPETEPVSDSSWCSPQRPASMYNVTVNAQSTTTRMPQSEEVVRRTDQVTKRIQELAAHMRSSDKCHSFVPHAERIRIAVSELSAIFPQNTNNDLIRHALRSLNTSTVRLQAECAQLEGSAERVRSCAYNMAKANKQLLTQFQ